MQIDLVVFDLETLADLDGVRAREVFGATRALASLHAQRIRTALVTVLSRRTAHAVLASLGWLGDAVDACVTIDDVGRAAPHADMVHEAMHELGVRDSARVAKASGTPAGLLQGAAAGCSIVIGVADRSSNPRLLRGAPCTHSVPTAALVPVLLERLSLRAAVEFAWEL